MSEYIEAAHWRDVPPAAWPWPNFTPAEIACRGTGKLKVWCEAMDRLQMLRTAINRPMIVTSAHRSPEHNARIGGAPRSRHVAGDAFDVSMANHDPECFEAAARAAGFTGFGFYPPAKGNFIHIDCWHAREWGTRWKAPQFDPEPVVDSDEA